MRAATVVQVLQDLFYVLLHVLFCLWSFLCTSKAPASLTVSPALSVSQYEFVTEHRRLRFTVAGTTDYNSCCTSSLTGQVYDEKLTWRSHETRNELVQCDISHSRVIHVQPRLLRHTVDACAREELQWKLRVNNTISQTALTGRSPNIYSRNLYFCRILNFSFS